MYKFVKICNEGITDINNKIGKISSEISLEITSDIGWGCTLRTSQMLLAETLKRCHLNKEDIIQYLNPEGIFSMKQMVKIGREKMNKNLGSWYGPRTSSFVIKELVKPLNTLSVIICDQGQIIKSEITNCLNNGNNVLLFIPLRLGIKNIEARYIDTLTKFLSIKQSVGIIGGKPSHSLYFIGYEEDNCNENKNFNKRIIYLNPHTIQDTSNLQYNCYEYNIAPINSLDPSISIGLCIKSLDDLNNIIKTINNIKSTNKNFIIDYLENNNLYSDLEF